MAVLSRHQEAAQLARPENVLNHIAIVSNILRSTELFC